MCYLHVALPLVLLYFASVVKAPPYEVTETGYAGFAFPIFVFFVGCKQEYMFEYVMDLLMSKFAKLIYEMHTVENKYSNTVIASIYSCPFLLYILLTIF